MLDNPSVEILNPVQAGVTRPHLDPAARALWLAAVHDSMRALDGAVTTAVEEPTVGRNYYRVGVRLRDGAPLNILFNAAASLVAAAEPQGHHSVAVIFVDVPDSNAFSEAGLQVGNCRRAGSAAQ